LDSVSWLCEKGIIDDLNLDTWHHIFKHLPINDNKQLSRRLSFTLNQPDLILL
jgi:hypothetical protein